MIADATSLNQIHFVRKVILFSVSGSHSQCELTGTKFVHVNLREMKGNSNLRN